MRDLTATGLGGCAPILPTLGVSHTTREVLPARLPHHARSYADGASWDWLRERMLELVLPRVGSERPLLP